MRCPEILAEASWSYSCLRDLKLRGQTFWRFNDIWTRLLQLGQLEAKLRERETGSWWLYLAPESSHAWSLLTSGLFIEMSRLIPFCLLWSGSGFQSRAVEELWSSRETFSHLYRFILIPYWEYLNWQLLLSSTQAAMEPFRALLPLISSAESPEEPTLIRQRCIDLKSLLVISGNS